MLAAGLDNFTKEGGMTISLDDRQFSLVKGIYIDGSIGMDAWIHTEVYEQPSRFVCI